MQTVIIGEEFPVFEVDEQEVLEEIFAGRSMLGRIEPDLDPEDFFAYNFTKGVELNVWLQ